MLGYMLVLFFVLPEEKHAGLLILPLPVLSAEALAFLIGLGDPARRAILAGGFTTKRVIVGTSLGVVALGLWTVAGMAAQKESRVRRESQVAQARNLADQASWQENEGDPLRQEWRREGEARKEAVAILAWVEADTSGVRLACREGTYWNPKPLVQYHDSPSRLFTTWHRIPDGEPCLFVVTLPGQASLGDERGDEVRLEVLGKGRILKTARLVIKQGEAQGNMPWLRTLVAAGEDPAGSPRLRSFSMSGITMHRLKTRDLYLGLELQEQALYDSVKWRPNLYQEDKKKDQAESENAP